ncbi:SDR family NAD(P)-dependent oxidoreductase [Leptospira wolffii]|uniref:SDR family NAD(P)-dependent oxidoreductase n=1 Tax=Leptospira wolffii TaxID=409998 RepID=UPI0010836BD2|nr:SDR family NAD(P)-dependent oxidoreductase [Leptospira wolffii]TGK62453.1 SDR family NAD(P)-dependent oxidoreductase [Leptospira wolffii]TGK65996.1 SDR family NAD(P)-dependent oxidoreductase [Leptospira wolffii]TGK74163.1 SDR family NAD(P)-dependent oxidoreductase [Leptospira wolffii]TGL29022.1 SDR family NAD(P)-dependent oxidoreductase [Leptospira wolffii]
MEYILVTGANSGVGLALTERLIQDGNFVFGSVRSKKQGAELSVKLGKSFYPLYFDVTDETAIDKASKEVANVLDGRGLKGLVNNAGVVVPGPLLEMPPRLFREQIEINLIAPFILSQKFLPLLGAKKDRSFSPGRIVNVSSMSGVRTIPFLAAYSVSKHGLEALTDGLRRELSLYDVDVISVLPGPIATPLTDKINDQIREIANGSVYRDALLNFVKINEKKAKSGVPMTKVLDTILHALRSPSPKTRYFLKSSFLTDTLLPKFLPTRTFDKLISKVLGIRT